MLKSHRARLKALTSSLLPCTPTQAVYAVLFELFYNWPLLIARPDMH